jgi:transcriptional regulator with XRE-family HTH domain
VGKRTSKTKPAVTTEEAFASVLRELRGQRGLSQEELGFESEYHRTYISMLERGLMNPSLRTILKLAAALKTTGADLVGRVEAHRNANTAKD